MSRSPTLEERWSDFMALGFPDAAASLEPDGIWLPSLDTFAAGCVSSYLTSRGLNPAQSAVLLQCRDDLQRVLAHPLPDDVHDYFVALQGLVEGVAEKLAIPG